MPARNSLPRRRPPHRLCWVMPSDPAMIAWLRARIAALSRQIAGPTPTDWWRLTTVLVEAVTNVIQHAHHDCPGYWLGLAMAIDRRHTTIRILDAGPRFRLTPRRRRGTGIVAVSGRGVQIMRAWCETMRIRRGNGLNEVQLRYRHGA